MENMFINQLAERLGYPASQPLLAILHKIVSESEAQWMVNLPATPRDLALKMKLDEAGTAAGLEDLFMRGLVLIADQTVAGPLYVFDTNPGRFMDMILIDPRYRVHGQEFYDLWRDFYNQDLVYKPHSAERFSFRIVPVNEKIEDKRSILPQEQAEMIVRNAKRIVVQECPCRVRERECDNPLEVCLALDQTAEYNLSRNLGREIGTQEALQIVAQAEKAGLIHETDNTEHPTVLCNCCTCCCVFLKAIAVYQQTNVVSKSRYFAQIDPQECVVCGACLERCHFGAIAQENGEMVIEAQRCYGCGLCSSICPSDAITLRMRDVEEIAPFNGGEFMKGMTKVPVHR